MRLWEKLSVSIFKILTGPWIGAFEEKSPEKMLSRSMMLLDDDALEKLKSYVKGRQHSSGGFMDRAGTPDLYYSLFGFFISRALNLDDILSGVGKYVEDELRRKIPEGVHLHCALIMASQLSDSRKLLKTLEKEIRQNQGNNFIGQTGYRAFVSLLSGYYARDYRRLFQIRKQLNGFAYVESHPSTVIAAVLVLRKSFNKPVEDLRNKMEEFYDKNGGFRAVRTAPVPDLLSTAVVLYSLFYTGYDLRIIKPDCMNYIDSLYADGGFAGNILDGEPDIEYTFYGLLALGSLAG